MSVGLKFSSLPAESEVEVLAFWKATKIFEKSLANARRRPTRQHQRDNPRQASVLGSYQYE